MKTPRSFEDAWGFSALLIACFVITLLAVTIIGNWAADWNQDRSIRLECVRRGMIYQQTGLTSSQALCAPAPTPKVAQ